MNNALLNKALKTIYKAEKHLKDLSFIHILKDIQRSADCLVIRSILVMLDG